MGREMIASTRTIRQYCSVCKATLDMAVIDTAEDHEVTWLKCPSCKGILPHMTAREDAPEAAAAEAPAAAPTPAVAGIAEGDRAGARDYDPSGTYDVGEIIYHRSIDRHGRVVGKTVLPGNRAAIVLQFEDGEQMTLREGS